LFDVFGLLLVDIPVSDVFFAVLKLVFLDQLSSKFSDSFPKS
jgi:hypothetical protein